MSTRSPEAQKVARKLASLGLSWTKQDGTLKVREREQLRRAFAAAAEFLGWDSIASDPVDTATRDVTKLAKAGARKMTQELEEDLQSKKSEITQLKKAATSIQKLADKADFSEPIEVTYTHTAREAAGLVTKVETVTLTSPDEARETAETIEKKLDSWGKLREQMLEELKRRGRLLDEMKEEISTFVQSYKNLVRDVFATLG